MHSSLITSLLPFILSSAIAIPTPQNAPPASGYKCFKGLDFPDPTEWSTFDELKNINLARISQGNTVDTVNSIFSDVQSVATEAGIDPRIVIAQIMQESQGQISKAGDHGKSIGLLQVQLLNGETGILCDPDSCSAAEILGMVEQGVLGTTRGDGPLAPGISFYLRTEDVGTSLRWYNTGSVPDPSDLSVASDISTSSYVSDVANRLMGLSPDAVYPDPSCGFAPPPW